VGDVLNRLALHVSAFGLLGFVACADRLPKPEIGPHVGESPVLVPYPPPPARVEVVPARPSKKDVWIDGEWVWQGRRWVWQRGGWQVPPANTYYAPPVLVRQPDGTLVIYQGGFRSKGQTTVKAP